MMLDSKNSLNAVQCAMICLLSQLIKDQLFVTAHTSLMAFYNLQATMLSSDYIEPAICLVSIEENYCFSIAPNCFLARPSTSPPLATVAELQSMLPPHL